MFETSKRLMLMALLGSPALYAQLAPARPIGELNQQQQPQQQQQQQQPPPQQPAAPAAPNAPPSGAPQLTASGGLMLNNVSLVEFIDILAKQLKLNYILDPGVQGRVTVYTYGEVKPVDLMQLLETMLRVNGAAMVKVGDLY